MKQLRESQWKTTKYKIEEVTPNTRYFIYWNTHKKLFSVRWKGKVIGHYYMLALADLKFKVNEQGRQRVLKEKCKKCPRWRRG